MTLQWYPAVRSALRCFDFDGLSLRVASIPLNRAPTVKPGRLMVLGGTYLHKISFDVSLPTAS